MVVWTNNSISNIKEFMDTTREGTEKRTKEYMNNLIDYIDLLQEMPQAGKKIHYYISNYEVRQLIYKKHRIFYYIDSSDVVILSIIHTRLDIKKAFRNLKKNI